MTIALYMDQHVPRAITDGLRLRDVDVLTAYEDGTSEWDDPALLDRALTLVRALFTRDKDRLAEAKQRQQAQVTFYGLIYAHQLRASIGQCVRDLEVICKVREPHDLRDQVIYLPL